MRSGGIASRGRAALVAGALVVAGLPPRAAAQDESEAAVAAARELFAAGDAAYARGDYEVAVDKFEQAYRLSPRPLLLFNIANACERQGAYARAADALRRYLPEAPEAERAAVTERLRRLDARARAAEADARALADARAHRCPVCDEPGATAPSALPRNLLWAAGGAALVTGLVLGGVARDAGVEAERSCVDGLCSLAAEDALDRERNFALASDLFVGAGLVATGAGIYLWWHGRSHREAPRAAVAPVVGGTFWGAGVVGAF